MADYVRRLVSGNKARFKDGELKMELDLVYVTDQIIIMGYPAAGLEGLYRNRREDAQKFLAHRHKKNFWVFNFCPCRENSYPASVFEGRVSRYPFPDHHAPPLPLLPLAAREMKVWLSGSSDRVAVLHCKAGKGRSGTLACSYLLTLDNPPTAPALERSHTREEWAKKHLQQVMDIMPEDDTAEDTDAPSEDPKPATQATDPDRRRALAVSEPAEGSADAISEGSEPSAPIIAEKPTAEPDSVATAPDDAPVGVSKGMDATPPPKNFSNALKDVLDLHTSRRMKAPGAAAKVKQGVSIPSQRRWLYYWSLLLAGEAPPDLWPSPDSAHSLQKVDRPKVRLTTVTIRMREAGGMKYGLVRAANMVIDRTNMGKNARAARGRERDQVWVSLARYDDAFVETLERWERHTRDDGVAGMGRRRKHSEHMGQEDVSRIFDGDRWDKGKMVRSFARFGPVGEHTKREESGEDGKIVIRTLKPLNDEKWDKLRTELQQGRVGQTPSQAKEEQLENGGLASETNSIYDLMHSETGDGVVIDAGREVRIKLYMGQVFMGWLWFIPTFHMSHPRPSSSSSTPPEPTKLRFSRKEIDFPVGIGSALVDVEVALAWCLDAEAVAVQPPERQTSAESEPAVGKVTAAVEAVATGDGVGDAVHAKQGADD